MRPPARSTTRPTSTRARSRRSSRWPPTSRRSWRRFSARTCASSSSACSAATPRIGRRWRVAPAAKYYHQAYRHGLLEHSLSVAQGVSAMAARFPGIDRDVAVTGALLHDIGKVEAYSACGDIVELTDHGKLLGEIPIGYYLVRRTIDSIDGFPAEDTGDPASSSATGLLEHGSPSIGAVPRPARPRSTSSAARSAASTGSRRAWPTGSAGRVRPRHLRVGLLRAARRRRGPRSRLSSGRLRLPRARIRWD